MRKGIVGLVLLAAIVVGGLGLAVVDSTRDPQVARAAGLVQYDSCSALLEAIQAQALEHVGPYGFDDARFFAADRGFDSGVTTDELVTGADATEVAPSAGGVEAEDGAAVPTTTAPGASPSSGDESGFDSTAGSDGAGAQGDPDVAFSDTNVQEQGVDEPDVVKTDGERLIAVVGTRLVTFDLTGDEPVQVGATELLTGTTAGGGHDTQLDHDAGLELLLSDDTALVLGRSYGHVAPLPLPRPVDGDEPLSSGELTVPAGDFTGGVTTLVEVDLSDLTAPEVVHTAEVEGGYTSARMVGDVARIVTSTYAPELGFVHPSDGSPSSEEVAERTNREVVLASTVEQWLPRVVVDGGDAQRAVACDQLGVPEEPSGFGTATVVTVDLAEGLAVAPGAAAAVLGGSEVVYASAGNLYVATTQLPDPVLLDELRQLEGIAEARDVDDLQDLPDIDGRPAAEVIEEAVTVDTAVHRFALPADGPATYEASGEVPGRMLSQFSFSEHDGHLRVATTVDAVGGSVSQLTVLAVDDLAVVGVVGDIGPPGEELYAVRMIGDVGYVVTFERTDPLFTLDLADPANPQVVGELEIPGYSSYLHPISDELIMGIGQAGTEDGVLTGTQVSLFDVSDPASPQRIQQHEVAGGSSEAEYDHRAFLYWPETGLTVLPISVYDHSPVAARSFEGAIGVTVTADAITEVGTITHDDVNADCEGGGGVVGTEEPTVALPEDSFEVEHAGCTSSPIRRSLVVGDEVLTLSYDQLQTSDLTTLERTAQVPFE